MATPYIEKRLAELLAARAKELEERARQRKRRDRPTQRRVLKWTEEQPPFWKIVRGKNWRKPPPDYMVRKHPFDVPRAAQTSAKMRWLRSQNSTRNA